MNARTQEKYRKLLQSEKNRIIEKTREVAEQDFNVNPDDLSDQTDLAVTEITRNLAFRLRDRERKLLSKIEGALSRIEEGSFGACLDCEEDIETKRLEARPVSTLCLNCKEVQEHREKVYA